MNTALTMVSLPPKHSKKTVHQWVRNTPLVVLGHIIKMKFLSVTLRLWHNGLTPTCYILLITGQAKLVFGFGHKQ
jgi:hypothetical protein